jgi:ubiquinone/menaquinone biosynthesis C-methylase UbiE
VRAFGARRSGADRQFCSPRSRDNGATATGGTGVEHHGEAFDSGPAAWAPAIEDSVMSDFSAVDDAADPRRLVGCLDAAAVGLGAMKQYIAVAHALRRPTQAILDIGCGVGHDLILLASLGVQCVGVDPSSGMLETATTRTRVPLVRAVGEHLPFRDDAFAGCRIERVLMHLGEPQSVLYEAVRCLRPKGLITTFEPDWTSLFLDGAASPWAGWLSAARHPAIGSELGSMLVAAGCTVVDRVEERSWWSFEEFERITNLHHSIDRAVAAGKIGANDAQQWIVEQRERAAAGVFRAEIMKVLWVAEKNE